MKTYFYIDNCFKIEQKDVNSIASKIGGIENTARKKRANDKRLNIEGAMLRSANLQTRAERAAKRRQKRLQKYAAVRKAKSLHK